MLELGALTKTGHFYLTIGEQLFGMYVPNEELFYGSRSGILQNDNVSNVNN